MPKFTINVVKRGTIDIDAPELDTATQKAAGLPDAAFRWDGREFEDCYESENQGREDL